MAPRIPLIEIGFPVFLADGADAFGAVRALDFSLGRPTLIVNVEGGGDFRVTLAAVEKVAARKVVVRWDLLDPAIQSAIAHATEAEDFPPPGGEAEIVNLGRDDSGDTLPSRYAVEVPGSPYAPVEPHCLHEPG